MTDQETGDLRVGILAVNADRELAEKYLIEIGVPCGFVTLKISARDATKIILKTLDANEARGRRRYVRADCSRDPKATFNVKILGKVVDGNILDLSSAGMAITFTGVPHLKPGTVLDDIQLKLHGVLARASGVIRGTRSDANQIHVVLFNDIAYDDREKIQRFVFRTLQDQVGDLSA